MECFQQLPKEITTSKLFNSALTHRSASKDNNERLEFLGDAVLGLVIANILFKKFPNCDEGDLSRLRAHLVCKRALAALAKEAKLSEVLRLGAGEKKSGGHFRASILADCLEAIIGAVYLLKGFNFTSEFIKSLYEKSLEELPDIDELKDPKTRLQEYLQSRQIDVPSYMLLNEWGEGNNKRFSVKCFIKELNVSSEGEEKSKKKAEQLAASKLLQSLLKK
ncbi:MAG: ribonuclease III [Gammaproteobacteria bacterium]|nr:ribonuclease III [Gammaproteobacteria bacterium]